MINRVSRLAILSALAMSAGVASEPEAKPEPPPPPLTPEQIKAQEKRARKAAVAELADALGKVEV